MTIEYRLCARKARSRPLSGTNLFGQLLFRAQTPDITVEGIKRFAQVVEQTQGACHTEQVLKAGAVALPPGTCTITLRVRAWEDIPGAFNVCPGVREHGPIRVPPTPEAHR